jgi:hypothetical protein
MPPLDYDDGSPIYSDEKTLVEQSAELAQRSRAQWAAYRATPRWNLWRRYWTRYDARRLACLANLLRLCAD